MENRPVEITFFLNGEAFAYRAWRHVPRVGDEVTFGDKGPYRVTAVTWGDANASGTDFRQAVNINLKG